MLLRCMIRSMSEFGRVPGRLVSIAMAAALSAAVACGDPATVPPPLELRIDSPAPGTVFLVAPVELTGSVTGAADAAVTYTVNGGPPSPAQAVAGTPGAFRIILGELAPGTMSIVVRAVAGGRVAEVAHAIEHVPVSLSLDVVPAAVHGRVIAFGGTVSHATAVIRYSVNGEAERVVQQYPALAGSGSDAGRFIGEAHPLRDGANTIEVRAYVGETVAATRSIAVDADVPVRNYDVTAIIDVASSSAVEGRHLGNDGRVAGYWRDASGTAHPFTWRAGTLVHLEQMGTVHGLNNVGQVLGVRVDTTLATIWHEGVYTDVPEFPNASMIDDAGRLARSLMPGYWDGSTFVAYPQQGMVQVKAMNNHGVMVGHTFDGHPAPTIWTAAGFQKPFLPAIYRYGSAVRIGDGGHVLQTGTTSSTVPEFSGERSLVLHEGVHADLNATVGFRAAAADVNADGVVAGSYERAGAKVAFTWAAGRTADVAIAPDEWSVETVYAVNDAGQLSVQARHRVTGRLVTLLLSPRG